MGEKMPKGYKCECGKFHEFSAYVYGHWDDSLTHSCPCGVTNNIKRGVATRYYSQRMKKPRRPEAE